MLRRLRVIEGRPEADKRVVFSMHTPIQQIDVPATAILEIAAREWQFFPGVERGFRLPHVEITLAPDIRAQIYRLTKALSDPRLGVVKTKLIVAGRCICEPTLDEPIGDVPSFLLSTGSLEQAEELAALLNAQRLEAGNVSTSLPE